MTVRSTSWYNIQKEPPKTRKLWYYLIAISIIGAIVYIYLFSPSDLAPLKPQKSGLAMKGEVTIIMNTFQRHKMMQQAIDYYTTCDLVKYIYVVWCEKNPPPERITKRYSVTSNPQVIFNIQTEDSLNTRFKPIIGPHTDSIFTVDDDMRVSCKDLGIGYEVWANSQRTLVGYMPRIHLRKKNGSWQYRCWWRVWWHGMYSIILTKAAFLHHDYLHLYTNVMPSSVRNLVDNVWNCEDIAMQFLIANTTSLPPIFVRGNLDDLGVLNGLSTDQSIVQAKHMGDRSKCINELVKIYGKNPLVKSHVIVNGANNGWVNAPSTWYEYISSDLWAWE